jgi:serine/threonine protein kinase
VPTPPAAAGTQELAPATVPTTGSGALALEPPAGPGEIGRLGKFRVFSILGEGGMGFVLKAEDPTLGRPVALKIIKAGPAASDAVRRRFPREAKAMAAVKHDHVIEVYEVGEYSVS